MRTFLASLLEIAEVVLIAVGAVVVVKSLLFQPFLVSGSSMVPTFSNGDYLIIDELTYRLREPERGEVVVFRFPKDESTYFIKRIIGLPGETVVVENGTVRIVNTQHPEGIALSESYLPSGSTVTGSVRTELGNGEYFVMGDNRSFSYDSRSWGSVKKYEIIGLVRVRLFPFTNMDAFAAPQYQ